MTHSPLIAAQQPDYRTCRGWLTALRRRYPFLEAMPIGQSVCGREIPGLMIGRGPHTVLFAAATHGQEWMTTLLLLRFCEEVCESLKNGVSLRGVALWRAMQGRRIVWVPTVNPDGVEIALHGSCAAGDFSQSVAALGGDVPGRWQANARGVDLNHNFKAGWQELQAIEQKNGIMGPAPRQYGGPAPESEPETKAFIDLCHRLHPAHLVTLHTQGEVIYWQYGHRTPERAAMMANIFSNSSGYALELPTGLASHGGMKDWFICHTGRPAFTVECGRGQNPLPLHDFLPIYQTIQEMLLLAAIM